MRAIIRFEASGINSGATATNFVKAVAAEMAAEHDGYYGRPHGRTEVKSLEGAIEVAALEIMIADHRGADDRSIGGRVVEVSTRPMAGYRVPREGCPAWVTSAGNCIAVWQDADFIYCAASGRRHGIRWGYLHVVGSPVRMPGDGDGWEVVELHSNRRDLLPWQTAT